MSNAHRRLLDLLAGWERYVRLCAESDEPHPGVTKEQYEAEADLIHELYQSVGAREDMTTEQVDVWVRVNMTALLRLGATPRHTEEP